MDSNSIAVLAKLAQSFASASPEAQKREYAQFGAKRRSELSRMQLATMAILMKPRDDARAMALLDEELKAADSRDEDLRSLAVLLKAMLAAQPKPEDNAQLMQKLKDEQKRGDMLQRKLDELMAVEKAMSDRREGQPQ